MDEFYSANLAQDVVRGMREAVEKGFWVAANAPYGYRRVRVLDGNKERAKLEINPDIAWVARLIFRLALKGMGTKEIAKYLNRKSIPSPGGKRWGRGRVHGILTNEVYMGTLVWGRRGRYHSEAELKPVRVEGVVEAIVGKQDFERVQDLLKARSPKSIAPRRTGSRYLLSGLLKCGRCGATMFGMGAKSGRYHYYVCTTSSRSGRDACDVEAIPQEVIEGLVLENVGSLILQRQHVEKLVKLVNEELKDSLINLEFRLAGIEKEIGDVSSRLGKLYDALETEKLSLEDLAPRIRELRTQKELLERARFEAKDASREGKVQLVDRRKVLEYMSDLQRVLDRGSLGERRMFLRSFVNEIVKGDTEATIHYTLPLPPNQIVMNPEAVLDIVSRGGPCGARTHDTRIKRAFDPMPTGAISYDSVRLFEHMM